MSDQRQFTQKQLLTAAILAGYARISDVTLWPVKSGVMGLSLIEAGVRKIAHFDEHGVIIGDWTVEGAPAPAS